MSKENSPPVTDIANLARHLGETVTLRVGFTISVPAARCAFW